MLNKNTLGIKKVRGQSEAALQIGATKNFDIGRGQVRWPSDKSNHSCENML